MTKKGLRGFQAPVARWMRVGCASAMVALAASGCSDDQKGTDINVAAPIAGSSGSNSQSGGSSSQGGTSASGTMNGESGAAEGGATDGGANAGGNDGTGTGGAAGKSSGGNAGMGGTAGTAGGGNGGAGGTGGHAGSSGSAGTAGTAGTAGAGGGAGKGGNGGNGGNQTCGNGIVEGTEECDADSALGPDRICADDCVKVSTPECVACEQGGNCFASSDNCKGPAATPFSAENVGICYDVVRCIQDSNCLDGSGTVGTCYCGSLSTAACGAAPFDLTAVGAPNGPCAAIMQKGFKGLSTNSAILGGLTNKSRPAGAAGQRLNCEKFSVDSVPDGDTTCAPICGLN